MKTMQDRLNELLDRDAIRQLPIAYAHYMRTRKVDDLIALYVPDGIFETDPAMFKSGGVYNGAPAIEKLIRSNVDERDPWPFTHNHFIEFDDDDHAHGAVYMEFRFGEIKLRTAAIGIYHDKYVRADGVWKFQERRLRTWPVEG